MEKPFGDREIGETFFCHIGGGHWTHGVKSARDKFLTLDGREVSVSFWTKTDGKGGDEQPGR